MGKRRDERVQLILPVRIYGMDRDAKPFTRLAHTVDVSASGARMAGLTVPLKTGEVVGVQHGLEKSRFKVVWIGATGTEQSGQIGLESLQPEKNIWRIPLPKGGKDTYEPKRRALERRRHPRFDCEVGVELRTDLNAPPMFARCTDISFGGCYLETWSPLPADTAVFIAATLPTGPMIAKSIVRSAHPAFGMAVQFLELDCQSASCLQQLIAEFSARASRLNSSLASPNTEDQNSTPAEPEPNPRKYRVLVVEDSRFQRNACAHSLRRAGIDTLLAEDGEQALVLAAGEHPDMIVLDLLLPRMSGIETLQRLKRNPATSAIPVVALSGLAQSNEPKLISSGAFAYLEKTHTGPDEVAQFVKRALDTSSPVPPAPIPVPQHDSTGFHAAGS